MLLHFETVLLNVCGLWQSQISVAVGMKALCLSAATALSSSVHAMTTVMHQLSVKVHKHFVHRRRALCQHIMHTPYKHNYCKLLLMAGEETIYSNCSDGELRLGGKLTATSGRLEVCYNRAWGTVCNYGWGINDLRVACHQLGFQPYGKISIWTCKRAR